MEAGGSPELLGSIIMSPKCQPCLLPQPARDLSLLIKARVNNGLLVGGRSKEQTFPPHLPALQGGGIEKT